MSRNLTLLLAAGAVLAVATPAFAAPPDRRDSQDKQDSGYVFRQDGKYLGRDPDASVRFELMRDGYANEN